MAAGATPQQIATARRRDATRIVKYLQNKGIPATVVKRNGITCVAASYSGRSLVYWLNVGNASNGETMATPYAQTVDGERVLFETPKTFNNWQDIDRLWRSVELATDALLKGTANNDIQR